MHVFGLTGGIGSGKSSAARRLAARGVAVVDADVLAREVVAEGTEGLRAVAARFGAQVLDQQGRLDRTALAALVFADPEGLSALNEIVHPLVRRAATERLAELERQGEPLAGYEVPLFFEVGLDRTIRPVVVVAVSDDIAIARAAERDGTSPAAVRARLRAQLPMSEKIARADYVIDNSGDHAELERRTDAVLTMLCARFGLDEALFPLP
jgi:dephospho-CoA kinase